MKSITGNAQVSEVQIQAEYSKVFNGFALEVSRHALSKIFRLEEVDAIWNDNAVNACLTESVAQIRADRVWHDSGLYGDSVLVGILDTGINYTHPHLGGGCGEGLKVIGGYNFVDDSPDCMDDNGHGTWVAGIVAADGVPVPSWPYLYRIAPASSSKRRRWCR